MFIYFTKLAQEGELKEKKGTGKRKRKKKKGKRKRGQATF
jgi:hypothetical protein